MTQFSEPTISIRVFPTVAETWGRPNRRPTRRGEWRHQRHRREVELGGGGKSRRRRA